MVLRPWHVGDVIRKLREQHDLTASALAKAAKVRTAVITALERGGPEVEDVTPTQWRALDRIAATFGLRNGSSLYKLIPEGRSPRRRKADRLPIDVPSSRVIPFARRK